MSKRDREGLTKRQEFKEKRRREERLKRLWWILAIVVGAVLIVLWLIYPQLKPIASIQAAEPRQRPEVARNSTGDPAAPVKLTEFSDFQCPYCKQFWQETEPLLIESYVKTGKVLFTYRSAGNWVSDNINHQLGGNDTESRDSAAAAYCAADQGKFWEMHDALYANVLGEADGISFTNRRLQAIAQNIGLDMKSFNECYSGGKYLDQVNQDNRDALSAGITGTPYFVLSYTAGGQPQTSSIEGARPFTDFQQAIEKALAAAGT